MRFALVAHRATPTNDALVEAAVACGLDAARLTPREALRMLEPGDLALARLDVRESLDGIEDGIPELERLAAGGVELLNPPSALVAAHDKLLTARALRLAGLPHPHTSLIANELPSSAPDPPLVVKPRFGSWGRDVERCWTREELESALSRSARKPWFREHGALVQELVAPAGAGRGRGQPSRSRLAGKTADGGVVWDIRIVVAGGRVVGAARRTAAAGEWRTNAALGARVEPVEPPTLARTLAIAAARALRADLVGVDLLPTGNGYVVLEVNGAVELRALYAPDDRDIFADAIVGLVRSAAERRAPVAV